MIIISKLINFANVNALLNIADFLVPFVDIHVQNTKYNTANNEPCYNNSNCFKIWSYIAKYTDIVEEYW